MSSRSPTWDEIGADPGTIDRRFAEHRRLCRALAEAWHEYFKSLPESRVGRAYLSEQEVYKHLQGGMRGRACEVLYANCRHLPLYDMKAVIAIETLIFGDSHLMKVHSNLRPNHSFPLTPRGNND
jgi:hypothetical protein